MINFKYVPLSFIKSEKAIERQSLNTLIFKEVWQKYLELKPLGELLEKTQYGYTASAKQEGECQLLRITDIKDGKVNWNNVPYCNCLRKTTYELLPKDILIARTGNNISYLVENDVPINAVFASYLIRLSCNKNVLLPEYLYIFLNSYAFWSQILKKQQGALLQNVNAKKMEELLIPYCSIEIQKEIIKNKNLIIINAQQRLKKKLFLNNLLTNEVKSQQALIKKLKQAILQEAIEGKLTTSWREQNSDVESASVLLRKIKAEKEQLIKDKKIKKQKPLAPINKDEIPFDVPNSWEWINAGEVIKLTDNLNIQTKLDMNDIINYVDIDAVNNITYTIDNIKIKPVKELSSRARRILRKDFIVYSTVRPYLNNITIIKDEITNFIGSTGFIVFQPINILNKYFFFFLLSPYIKKYYLTLIGDFNSPSITNDDFFTTYFPLPPLEEQSEIVRKVENLFKVCDELEIQINNSKINSQTLMQAVLKEAFTQ